MLEAEPPGMERLARKRESRRRALTSPGRPGVLPLSDERMPSQRRLDPDLIALPRVEPHLDHRGARKPLDDAVPADGLNAARIMRVRRPLRERHAIPREPIAPCAIWWR